jgi:16S rRNA (cytosine967-C5)-methyltransferase
VPCSGLGIIRRKPDIKWNKDDVSGLYEIQKKILENGAAYLKNGGELVYSTCTIDKNENENVTSEFLENHNDFEKLYEKTYYPNVDKTDGFYICKMRKL